MKQQRRSSAFFWEILLGDPDTTEERILFNLEFERFEEFPEIGKWEAESQVELSIP